MTTAPDLIFGKAYPLSNLDQRHCCRPPEGPASSDERWVCSDCRCSWLYSGGCWWPVSEPPANYRPHARCGDAAIRVVLERLMNPPRRWPDPWWKFWGKKP